MSFQSIDSCLWCRNIEILWIRFLQKGRGKNGLYRPITLANHGVTMEEGTSNMTIAVMMDYLSCHEVEYSWSKSYRDDNIFSERGDEKAVTV